MRLRDASPVRFAKLLGGVQALRAAIAKLMMLNQRAKAIDPPGTKVRQWSEGHLWAEADKYDEGTRMLQGFMRDPTVSADELPYFQQFLEGQALHGKNLRAHGRNPSAQGPLQRGSGIMAAAERLLEQSGGRIGRR